MSTAGELNDLLEHASRHMGVHMELDANGVFVLEAPEDTRVTIELPENSVSYHLYTSLGEVPEGEGGARVMMEAALELNMFQIATEGGAIGMSYERRELFYCFSRAVGEVSAEVFVRQLEAFIVNAVKLKRKFEQAKKALDDEGVL